MDADQPLATYRERLLQVSRRLELHPDRVVARARWLTGRTYSFTVTLATLRPEPTRMWIRQRLFRRTLTIAALSAATAVVLNRPGYDLPRWVIFGLFGLAVIAGAITVIAWRKVLFVRFSTRENTPGLDIARAGPDVRQFDEFIDQLKRAIRKA